MPTVPQPIEPPRERRQQLVLRGRGRRRRALLGGSHPELRAAHRARGGRCRAVDLARHPDPDRGAAAALRRGRADVVGRAVRHARALEHDAPHAAWTRATLVVPPFSDATSVTLPVTCSYDLEVNATNYLSGLQDGEVPLEFLFSGSVFYAGPGGMLQTARIVVGSRGRVSPADQSVARGDGPPLPRCRLAATRPAQHSTACGPTKPSTGCARWRTQSIACWQGT